ncbi:MAG: hypothetical protein ACI9Y1_001635 [Lentisphaeria bacterium]
MSESHLLRQFWLGLYQRELCAYRDSDGEVSRYVIASTTSHVVIATQEKVSPVVSFQELLSEPIGDYLLPILEMRALLPLVSIRQGVIPVRILDSKKKPVVQLRFEHNSDNSTRSQGQVFDELRLCISALGRAPKMVREVLHRLEKFPDISSAQDDMYERALESIGRVPGDYSSKFSLRLNAQERSDIALQSILENLFHTMQLNEPGVREDIDPEFLHDYRVAIRRTRSALS